MTLKLKKGYILLDRLRFHAFHGVMEQERTVGNDYEVSLRLEYPLGDATRSDCVDDTLNYAAAYALVRDVMAQPSQLVEHVAARVGERLLEAFPRLVSVDVRVMKLNPPMGACCEGAGVELHLINDKTGDLPFGFS